MAMKPCLSFKVRILSVALILPIALVSVSARAIEGVNPQAPILTNAAVAVPDEHAAHTAEIIFDQGGNAIDAAVAIAFTLAVTYPEAGNIGGGGFMTVYHEGRPYFLDYRERAPGLATRDMYLDESGKVIPPDDTRSSVLGHRAVGVPGTVAGMWEAHKRFGKLSWSQVLEPSINLAKDGFKVSAALANLAKVEIDSRFHEKTNFAHHFSGLLEGNQFKQPDLEAVLRRIGARGASDFYTGETSKLITQDMKNNGGLITRKDLKDYKPVWREPIKASWNGFEVVTAPPPSSGGIGLVQLLKLKEIRSADFYGVELNSPQYIHLVSEIEKRVFADRAEYLGDPDFYSIPIKQLLESCYLEKRAAEINVSTISITESIAAGLNFKMVEKPQTTHFSVIDKWGNAVSNTYTLNGNFGSGAVVEKAGIILNDQMDDFSAQTGVANQMGVLGSDANSIAPGKRPLSSMTPTILLKNGRVALVIGTPGGSRIFTSVFQVVSNVYDFNMPIASAVASQRFHHQLMPKNTIFWEPFAPIQGKLAEQLIEKGYNLSGQYFNGDIQAIMVKNGVPFPVSDPRGRGVSATY